MAQRGFRFGNSIGSNKMYLVIGVIIVIAALWFFKPKSKFGESSLNTQETRPFVYVTLTNNISLKGLKVMMYPGTSRASDYFSPVVINGITYQPPSFLVDNKNNLSFYQFDRTNSFIEKIIDVPASMSNTAIKILSINQKPQFRIENMGVTYPAPSIPAYSYGNTYNYSFNINSSSDLTLKISGPTLINQSPCFSSVQSAVSTALAGCPAPPVPVYDDSTCAGPIDTAKTKAIEDYKRNNPPQATDYNITNYNITNYNITNYSPNEILLTFTPGPLSSTSGTSSFTLKLAAYKTITFPIINTIQWIMTANNGYQSYLSINTPKRNITVYGSGVITAT